ncbi:two-component system sporulation sensor kinase A [Virgibacillus natechei]|uniref:histidine kinase n=1 Tax=Virgibacillus natechei TaxID=1216297 RepID=A0ABS4IC74_9BACI|nr:ATP-binding protein [Virgibacillus natechei]MBP1967956.1 two-component system sporulation sensor kinase A [Virgibacillus natechei]UZD14756.1 ATP-binding protein [Virgibacillus natechei]
MGFENLNPDNNENNQNSNTLNTIQYDDTFSGLSSLPSYMLTWIEENKNDVITVWDQYGRMLYISKSIERILGYKTSDLHNLVWSEKISPEDVRYIEKNFDRDINTGQVFNVKIQNKQGKYIWSECVIAKLQSEDKNDVHYIATINDITDKKEAEEMMLRSEKMSVAGQLAAGVAHEIRNPLTSIKGFLQLLQAGGKGKEEYYSIMLDEIEKMEAITSELLFISKPITETMNKESIEEMMDDVLTLMNSQANLKNIKLEANFTYKGFVHCNRSQIKQVLINLVKNAIEAMDDPGTITLVSNASEKQVELSIIDEGPGIPEEIIHKLGEPFFTTKNSGTGLGIMITKQILERHDGTLEIEQNIDKGTTFRILMPL